MSSSDVFKTLLYLFTFIGLVQWTAHTQGKSFACYPLEEDMQLDCLGWRQLALLWWECLMISDILTFKGIIHRCEFIMLFLSLSSHLLLSFTLSKIFVNMYRLTSLLLSFFHYCIFWTECIWSQALFVQVLQFGITILSKGKINTV